MVVDHSLLLDGRYVATLATENEDGSAYLTAVWFLWQEGAFHIPTSSESRKARNVAARGRASVMVDSRSAELRGLSARGAAILLHGREARELNALIHRRYVTETGIGRPDLGGLLTSSDDVTIRVVPERWHEWDMTSAFGDLLTDPALVLPLDR